METNVLFQSKRIHYLEKGEKKKGPSPDRKRDPLGLRENFFAKKDPDQERGGKIDLPLTFPTGKGGGGKPLSREKRLLISTRIYGEENQPDVGKGEKNPIVSKSGQDAQHRAFRKEKKKVPFVAGEGEKATAAFIQ